MNNEHGTFRILQLLSKISDLEDRLRNPSECTTPQQIDNLRNELLLLRAAIKTEEDTFNQNEAEAE